jgi:VWFA-related protein
MYRQLLIGALCVALVPMGALAQRAAQLPQNAASPAVTPGSDAQKSGAADEQATPVFRTRSALVQVPAVVTDKSSHHLHGLTKEDFKVLEDGKEQRIASLEEISATNTQLTQSPDPPGTLSNFFLDGQQKLAVTVIALDTINTPFLDQYSGRMELIKYLAHALDPEHVFALLIIGSKGVQVVGGLDSDPRTLIAALKKVSGERSAMQGFSSEAQALAAAANYGADLTGGVSMRLDPEARLRAFVLQSEALQAGYYQERAIEETMRAFLAISWSLSGIPGRKSIIWATGSFPFALDFPSSLPGGKMSLLYTRTLQALNDAQVSVYPVDVRGLVGTIPTNTTTLAGVPDASAQRWSQMSSLASLTNFAEMTGGRAFYNNNDLGAGFKSAVDDSSSYYLLSYYADHQNTKPGWRKLQVKVAREKVEVHARNGYMVSSATTSPQLTHNADLDFALSSPFDSTGLHLTMKWLGVEPDGDKKKVGFTLRLPATGLIDEADQNRFDVDFVAQAIKNGAPAGNAAQTVKGTMPAATLAKVKSEGLFFSKMLELPPGEYQVRFVVRDNLRGRIGSVSAPLLLQ